MVARLSTTALSLAAASSDLLLTNNSNNNNKIESSLSSTATDSSMESTSDASVSPRVMSVIFMAIGMAFHFGGYEFIRNSCLALFTSKDYGFATTNWAFPFANGLVSPFSVILLWWYGNQLDQGGPRYALRRTTIMSVAVIGIVAALLRVCQVMDTPRILTLALVGFIFLFQNSYQYLIYTQQWSFLSSVLTPDEGSKWFSRIAGLSSIVCGLFGSMVPYMLPVTGLLGLLATTCITLTVAMVCQDRAYALAQKNGFDPAEQMMKKKLQKQESKTATADGEETSKLTQAKELFQRVPTLRALMSETLTFQSLNNILNVAFVMALKETITNDHARSAYTGRFYALTNIVSASLQFLVVPIVMKYAEAKWIWRLMPLVPITFLLGQITQANLSLSLLAAAFGLAKIMDYAMRNVVYPMAYQPLDFESRYVGKEIIGVLGSRFGKSGMSLFLSGLTGLFGSAFGLRQLIYLAFGSSGAWMGSTWWLSSLLPKQAEAEAIVEDRNQKRKVEKAAEAAEEQEKKNE